MSETGRRYRALSFGRSLATLSLIAGILTVSAGCGAGGGNGGAPPVPPTITSVTVSCSPTAIHTNQTSTCTPSVNGTGSFSSSVTWSVSPTSIGAVSGSGVFTPGSLGTATITATSTEDSTKSGSATVTVTLAPPSNLVYPQTTILASVGQAITPDTPTVTGTVSSYGISPALPAGLSLNTTTGTISGTPTAVAAQTTYTVTATNTSGSCTAALQITVTLAAPSNLVYPQTTIAASVGQAIIPDIPTVTGTVNSYSVSPALPAGLSLNITTGTISGTPSAVAAQTAYTVTVSNAGGNTTASVTITVVQAQNTLLELGHASTIEAIRFEGGNVLSADLSGHWALWNYTSGALLASGDGTQPDNPLPPVSLVVANPIDMAGPTVVDGVANGLEIRAQSDGHLLSTIVYPGLNILPSTNGSWWKLASDGSYICIGSKAGLFVYTPAGQMTVSESGDYSGASVFAAPGQVLVALGPAGQNVIASISTVNGATSVSPAFSGQFNSWFVDGGNFLTNLGTTVWVYSNTGVQQALVQLPTISSLTGQGNFIWIVDGDGSPVDIYPIGSETPALSINGDPETFVVTSGTRLGILDSTGAPQISVIDLSGTIPLRTNYAAPVAHLATFAASSSSQWIVGNSYGVLLDGASLPGTPRYFGQGAAWSIAGAANSAAVSTAIGNILVFDPYQSTLEEKINFSSGKVSLSADGTVLGASAEANDYVYEPDRTLNFYSLPSENVISSFPYTIYATSSSTYLFDFTLAASGATIGQETLTGEGAYITSLGTRRVTTIHGGSVIWSDNETNGDGTIDPILLSPDGTLIAVTTDAPSPTSVTNIFQNGTLVTAVAGYPVGWIDNNRLLVDQYTAYGQGFQRYSGCTIYSAAGVPGATPSLPVLKSIQTVNSDSVYDPSHNAIYSLTTGQPIWTASFPGSGVGAVSGAYVVYESGHSVVVESH